MSLGSDNNDPGSDEQREWMAALEEIIVEALRAYYQGTPLFSDAEFNTLRDELEHLGLSQVRLYNVEKIWVQATSARDFDRRMCQEFDLSEEDLRSLKHRLLVKGAVSKPSMKPPQPYAKRVTGSGSKGGSGVSMKTNMKMGGLDLTAQRESLELPWQGGQEPFTPQETTAGQQQQTPGMASPDDFNNSFNEEEDQQEKQFLADASELTASQDVNERIKW